MQKQGKDVDKIVIIIHGFMASLKASWVHEMKNTIQDMEENTAVMVRLLLSIILFVTSNCNGKPRLCLVMSTSLTVPGIRQGS